MLALGVYNVHAFNSKGKTATCTNGDIYSFGCNGMTAKLQLYRLSIAIESLRWKWALR